MSSDTAASGQFQVNIPADLVNELQRNRVPRPNGLKVDGMKRGLLDRLFGGLDEDKRKRG